VIYFIYIYATWRIHVYEYNVFIYIHVIWRIHVPFHQKVDPSEGCFGCHKTHFLVKNAFSWKPKKLTKSTVKHGDVSLVQNSTKHPQRASETSGENSCKILSLKIWNKPPLVPVPFRASKKSLFWALFGPMVWVRRIYIYSCNSYPSMWCISYISTWLGVFMYMNITYSYTSTWLGVFMYMNLAYPFCDMTYSYGRTYLYMSYTFGVCVPTFGVCVPTFGVCVCPNFWCVCVLYLDMRWQVKYVYDLTPSSPRVATTTPISLWHSDAYICDMTYTWFWLWTVKKSSKEFCCFWALACSACRPCYQWCHYLWGRGRGSGREGGREEGGREGGREGEKGRERQREKERESQRKGKGTKRGRERGKEGGRERVRV